MASNLSAAPASPSSSLAAAAAAGAALAAAADTAVAAGPGGKPLPSFLRSLFSIVNDPATDALVCWSGDGTSFIITDADSFAAAVLPQYYRHGNFSSFARQLCFCE